MPRDVTDRLLGLVMAANGNKQAHWFIGDYSGHFENALSVKSYLHGRHTGVAYIPPKEEDRVIVFQDGSGVYVHSDGFITPMGDDIRHETKQWRLA